MNSHPNLPPEFNGRDYRPAPAELAPRQYVEAPEYYPQPVEETDGLLQYWRIIRRHKGWLILAGVLGALAGTLLTLPQTPVYQAKVSIEIQTLNENFLNLKDVSLTENRGWGDYDIQTQVKVLESRMLAERVLRRIKAETRGSLPVQTDRLDAWRKALHLDPPKPLTEADAVASASVKVKPVMNTRVVEVFCDSIDPKLAAQYANTMAEEYITDNMESRWKSTQSTGEWLTRQIQDLKIKLEQSEDQLQAYSQSVGLLFTGGDKEKENVNEEKLRQLQTELLRAQTDRIAKESKYELAKSIPAASLPEVLDDESLRASQSKLTDLRRQMAELSATLTPAHYKVQRLQAQIDELKEGMDGDLESIRNRIQNDFETASRREKLLAADYEAQKRLVVEQAGKLTHYNILKREVDTNRQLYESMLQRVKETGVAAAMKASGIRIIDRAIPPDVPYKPDLKRGILTGIAGGMFLGVVLVFLRERADRSVQQPGDASFYLNVPELGVIPIAGSERRRKIRTAQPARLIGSAADTHPINTDRVELVSWARKPSLMSEAFRNTLTSILFSGRNGDRPRVVVLTSANPGEGKTTVTINLAISLAEISQRVLIIDADMRRPRLHEILELGPGPGLSELLREKDPLDAAAIEKYVRPTQIPGLSAMRSGRSSEYVANLLHSPRLPELLQLLRKSYDSVLIDSPPALQISDSRVLGRSADAVILVLRAGRTTRDAVMSVKQRFADDGTPIMGTILNRWNPKHAEYGYQRYASYYYQGKAKAQDAEE